MGCTYRSNTKAWMTQTIFLEWLEDFDSRIVNRHVLLILDNCSAHVPLAELPDRIQLKKHISLLPSTKYHVKAAALRCWDYLEPEGLLLALFQPPSLAVNGGQGTQSRQD